MVNPRDIAGNTEEEEKEQEEENNPLFILGDICFSLQTPKLCFSQFYERIQKFIQNHFKTV